MSTRPTVLCVKAESSLDKYPAKQHAQQVATKLGVTSGLIFLLGQQTIWQEDSDEPYPFRQRRYFYYLSGVDERDCSLTYDVGEDKLTLYIPFRDKRFIIYNGVGLTAAEAYDKYDIDAVAYASEASTAVQSWTKHHPKDKVFILHPTQEAFPGQNKLPHVDFTKLQVAIDQCRVIKYPHEIEKIRMANAISAEAHRTVLTNIAGLSNEAQVEAIFKEMCISRLAKRQAYNVIAAAGENAATLHYNRNTSSLAGQQLMVLDAGCEWELYASDITRTFPLSGSWPSPEARDIHDLVLCMQLLCIRRIKPGVRFLDLHHSAHQIMVKRLLYLGVLHNGEVDEIIEAGTSLAFFPHGLGHHLGLEVHDVSDLPINGLGEGDSQPLDPAHAVLLGGGTCHAPVDARSGALEEGMVVTVEPGVYFSRFALEEIYLKSPVHSKYINKEVLERYYPVGGVRIEDDILVTKNGHENLTTAPKGEEMLRLVRQGYGESRGATMPGSDVPLSRPSLRDGNQTSSSKPSLYPSRELNYSVRQGIRVECTSCRKQDHACIGGDADLKRVCRTCILFRKPCTFDSRPTDPVRIPTALQPTATSAGGIGFSGIPAPFNQPPTLPDHLSSEMQVLDPLPSSQTSSLFHGFQQTMPPGRFMPPGPAVPPLPHIRKRCAICLKREANGDWPIPLCRICTNDNLTFEGYPPRSEARRNYTSDLPASERKIIEEIKLAKKLRSTGRTRGARLGVNLSAENLLGQDYMPFGPHTSR